MILKFLVVLQLITVGIYSVDDGCVYCGYKKHDSVDVPVAEFSKQGSISVKFLLRNNQECNHMIIPSVQCHVMQSTTEIKFLHDSVTGEDLLEWFAKEKLRIARKTPVLRNLTCILDAVRDDRPLVLAFVSSSLFEKADELFSQVKKDWPVFLFYVVDSGIHDADKFLAKGFDISHIEANSIIFRQYIMGDVIIGSFYTMNAEKLRSMLRLTHQSSKLFLNPNELFNYRSGKMVSKPTLVFVFMMYYPNLAYDLFKLNETVYLLRERGLDLDFFLFNIDRYLNDISHSPEADFIISFSHLLFAFGRKSATFELPTVGPSDLVRALTLHTWSWKRKELDIFSRLNHAWKLDEEQSKSPVFRVEPLVCNVTETPPKVTKLAPKPQQIANESPKPEASKLKSVKRKSRLIPSMTQESWQGMLNSTLAADNPYDLKRKHTETFLSQVKVTVVVFTRSSGCRHCSESHHYFQELYNSIVDGSLAQQKGSEVDVSMFVFDCNTDFEFCLSKVGTFGFPSIMAVRHLPIKDLEHCIPQDSAAPSHTRFFYHGVIETEELITWLSKQILSPSLSQKAQPPPQHLDAQLLVQVLPPWSKKFPRSPVRKLHPFCLTCMRYVCEQLHGLVPCVLELDKESSEVVDVQANFVVNKIILQRADGVRAVVMEMATPLAETMDRHGPLHNFHQTHQYNFSPRTLCEDDHKRCTELLFHFTKDHARLPVTALSEEMLHQDRSLFPKGMPLLIALVHSSNLTAENATFANMIQKLAKVLYNRIVVASLDIDLNNFWGSRFVPADYSSNHISSKSPAMYHYPRFAIIDRLNHNEAAFYPAPQIGFKSEYSLDELLNFVTQYLAAPENFMKETERF